MNVTVSTRDQASQQLGVIQDSITKGDVAAVMGRAVQQALRAHFFKLNRERPNVLGGKRTNFYAQTARSVQAPRTVAGGVSVSITQLGIAQRRFGGRIKATASNWLTIPARKEAHGKRAREFDNLHFELVGGKWPALVENAATIVKRGKDGIYRAVRETGGLVMFWLKKSVFQKADPNVLPTEASLATIAVKAGGSYLARIGERRTA